MHCKSFLITNGEMVIKQVEHSHLTDNAGIKCRDALNNMKRRINDIGTTQSQIYGTFAATLRNDVLMALPSKESIHKRLRRTRKANNVRHGVDLGPPPININFEIPALFRDFVLHDFGVNNAERFLIFGCNELLDGLARAEFWFCDGTFKVTPLLFFNCIQYIFQHVIGSTPVGVYCSLPNKIKLTYDRLISALKNLIPAANPTHIMVDFKSRLCLHLQKHTLKLQLKDATFTYAKA